MVNAWQWLMLLQFCYFAQKQTEKDSEKEKPSDTQLWYYSPHGWAAAFRLGISNINCNFSVSNSLDLHRINTNEKTIKTEKINIFRMLSLCILKTIRISTDKSAMIENTESPPVRNPAQLSTLTPLWSLDIRHQSQLPSAITGLPPSCSSTLLLISGCSEYIGNWPASTCLLWPHI